MTSPGNTTVSRATLVSAKGTAGRYSDYTQVGSGGGAGGSIQVTTLNLLGDGTFTVAGG